MKKLLLFLLILCTLNSQSQYGTAQFNNFGPPLNPPLRSAWWLNGSIPLGSNPILEMYGLYKLRSLSDSLVIDKLALREDPNPYKLMWIGSDAMVRAFTPNYLTSINSGQVIAALGYTPYSNSNPSGYISGVTYSDIITALGYIPVNPSGNNLQYLRGDGSLAIFPSIPASQVNCDWNSTSGVSQLLNKPALKRIETYLGTTDGSGNYTVVYSTPFLIAPDIQPQLQTGTTQQIVRITANSTTGFTVNATNRATVTLLGIDVLLGNTTPLVGATIGVLVTSR